MRARAQRLFTVPTGTPNLSAASATGIPLDIDGDDGSALLRGQRCQRLFDGQAHVHSRRVIAVITGFLRILGRQRERGPRFVASDPVKAGIDHDGVEPTTHRRIAAELRRLAVRGEQTLLECVCRVLVRVTRTPGNVPQMILMPDQ
ncbi:hypothetical protein QV65_31800 [Rhodococcus erythropolis]|nr:hypothetical protein QV65_31800 [Rhodococcus erythropolis]